MEIYKKNWLFKGSLENYYLPAIEAPSTYRSEFEINMSGSDAYFDSFVNMERSNKLSATISEVLNISAEERNKMWLLYSNYYDGATWDSFNYDMNEKTHIIIARDTGDNSIQGFSTLKKFTHLVDGKKIVTLYSGDTIIHPNYWGQRALHLTFFKFVLKAKLENPFTKVFWFLLCNGYRTYLVFARNITNYWPRHDRETPLFEKNIINSLASQRFGKSFDAEKGIVAFTSSLGLLKPGVAPIGENELKDPAIKFLVNKNPGYIKGDELCCLGEISFGFILFYPFKLIKKIFSKLL